LNKDTLTGGSGQDRFLFNSALRGANVDTIMDFSLTDDQLRLENSIFTGLPTTGPLPASAFRIGNQATTAAHRIIYVSGTGALFYDKDGSGPTAQVRFATLTPGLALTNTHFVVQ
jgi:Ca2+-binding RTX toxin-like protein